MPRPASTLASGHCAASAASGLLSRPGRGSGTSPAPGPPARSSNRHRTVSAASDLLVPMTPVGPRLSQPATYSPGRGTPSGPRTRPWAFGTIEARALAGLIEGGQVGLVAGHHHLDARQFAELA